MRLDTIIISEKLESLRKCVLRIEEKTPANADVLINDLDLQDYCRSKFNPCRAFIG